jgi:hypothetical protein
MDLASSAIHNARSLDRRQAPVSVISECTIQDAVGIDRNTGAFLDRTISDPRQDDRPEVINLKEWTKFGRRGWVQLQKCVLNPLDPNAFGGCLSQVLPNYREC